MRPMHLVNYPLSFLLLAASVLFWFFTSPAGLAARNVDKSNADVGVSKVSTEWKNKWAVPDGFSIDIDTEGYEYPTAIAFVPNPGADPKDPLYFVTELRGTVKVVTNDRTVHTFAEGFMRTDLHGHDVTSEEGASGLAGVCLDPMQGYVFVTFAYKDENGVLRNNVIRFKTTPGTFSVKPHAQQPFTEVFAPYESGLSHQIGPCQVHDRMLYISVGDGFNFLNSQQLDNPLGKIIRMTLDGKPVPANPFYKNNDIQKARNYIWAYGLRNPFSLKIANGHVMVAENGISVDRFLEVKQGQNYLWSGNDESTATNAAYVFLDSLGPVQMDYYPDTASFFPARYAHQLYLALSSGTGVMRLNYGFKNGKLLAVPEYFVKNTEGVRWEDDVVGLAFGPDGLYFAPLSPVRGGKGAVIKVKYDPQNAHNVTLEQLADSREIALTARNLMNDKGCFGCHRVRGVYEQGGTQGPVLDQGDGPMVDRILKRISSKEYLQSLQALDKRNDPLLNHYEQARDEVAKTKGLNRVRIWMKYHILEPRFDGASAMPNQGLTESEAATVTSFLLAYDKGRPLDETIAHLLPQPRYRYFAYAFAVGIVFGLPIWLLLWWLLRLTSRRRRV